MAPKRQDLQDEQDYKGHFDAIVRPLLTYRVNHVNPVHSYFCFEPSSG